MKKTYFALGGILAAIVLFLVLGAAAPAPVQRNQFTTNVPGAVVLGPVAFGGAVNIAGASGHGGLNTFTNGTVNQGTANVTGAVGVGGTLTASNAVVVGGTENVTGASFFGGAMTAAGTVYSASSITAAGGVIATNPSVTVPTLKITGIANTASNIFEVWSNLTMIFSISSNGVVTMGGAGQIVNAGTITSAGTIQTQGSLRWNASSTMNGTTVNGNIRLQNSGGTSFGSLQWGGTTTNWPALVLIQSGTNSVANVLGLGDASSGASGAMLEIKATPNSMTNNNPSSDSARIFASLDGGGVAQLWVKAEDGTTKQITEHAIADAPQFLVDGFDDMPNISKEIQPYLGKVRWINRSREAFLTQLQFWGTNVNAMPTNKTTFIFVETFQRYNTRLGLSNGNELVQVSWSGVQAEHQATYDAGRLNDIAQIAAGFTNVVVRPVADIRKPVPAWLAARGVN